MGADARTLPPRASLPETLAARMVEAMRGGDMPPGSRIDEWRDAARHFHDRACRHAGNELLLRAWLSMSNLMRPFPHRHPAFEKAGQLPAALHSREPDGAEAEFHRVILESGFRRHGLHPPPGTAA